MHHVAWVGLMALVFVVLDALWFLALGMGAHFKTHIGHLMASEVQWLYALAVYVLMALGLYVLVMVPYRAQGLLSVLKHAMLLGLVVYGVYETTNAALLKNWPHHLVVLDMFWGVVVFGMVAAITHKVMEWWL